MHSAGKRTRPLPRFVGSAARPLPEGHAGARRRDQDSPRGLSLRDPGFPPAHRFGRCGVFRSGEEQAGGECSHGAESRILRQAQARPVTRVQERAEATGSARVVGRTEGDLKIPIDGRISSRHVEITLQTVGGLHRWVVTDLQSTHGMFVRVSRTVLAERAEFLVGNGRYRFDSPQALADATVAQIADPAVSGATQGWDGSPSPFRPPAVTELIGNEIGNRILLVKPEYWIGTDPTGSICRSDDPFCEPRHVRLFRTLNGSWYAEHNRTQNGLWLRMSQIVVDPVVRFQIGEQRFLLKV